MSEIEEEMMSQEEVSDNLVEHQTKVEKKEVVQQPKKSIEMDDKGRFLPKDASEEYRIADMLIASRAVPKVFETAAQVMMGMQFLRRFNIDPIIGMRQVTIVNGSLSLWGELPLALVRTSPDFESFKEIIYDKDYKEISFENKNLEAEVYGATCWLQLKGDPEIYERSFTIKDAKEAGLIGKDIWKKYLKRMLQMRARAWCLKDAKPEALSGVQILEYDTGTMVDKDGYPIVKEKLSLTESLNNKYLGTAKTEIIEEGQL